MEQELSELLGILKDGLAELPEFGGNVWDIYVSGRQIEAIIWLILSAVTVVIVLLINVKFWVIDINESYQDIILVASIIFTFISIIVVIVNLVPAIAPEYSIIKQVVHSLDW